MKRRPNDGEMTAKRRRNDGETTAKRRRNDGKILDLLKSSTLLAQLDRHLPNLAGRRIEATGCVLTFEIDPKWRKAAMLDLLKPVISPARLDRFRPNFAGRHTEATDILPVSVYL